MNNKFYIGQDVVCIKTHSQRIVVKDEVYPCNGLSKKCDCGVAIDVGIIVPVPIGELYKCADCRKTIRSDGKWWMDIKLFVTLDSLVNIDELTEVLTEPIYS